MDVGSCVVSTCEELSYPYRTYPELATQLDKSAKTTAWHWLNRRESRLCDGQARHHLAAVSQRVEHAKALRIVDASKRRLPLQKKIGAG